MSCGGNPCEYMFYKVKSTKKVTEEFSDGCSKSAKEKLLEKFRDKLDETIQGQKEVVAGCSTGCECFIDEDEVYDDDEGWQFAGDGEFTDTVADGKCTLKKTVKYRRVAKKIEGHCYKPLPKPG